MAMIKYTLKDMFNEFPGSDKLCSITAGEAANETVILNIFNGLKKLNSGNSILRSDFVYSEYGKYFVKSNENFEFPNHWIKGDEEVEQYLKQKRFSKEEIDIVIWVKRNMYKIENDTTLSYATAQELLAHEWFKYLYLTYLAKIKIKETSISDKYVNLMCYSNSLNKDNRSQLYKIILSSNFSKKLKEKYEGNDEHLRLIKSTYIIMIKSFDLFSNTTSLSEFKINTRLTGNFEKRSLVEFVTEYGIYMINGDFISKNNAGGKFEDAKILKPFYYSQYDIHGIKINTIYDNWYQKLLSYIDYQINSILSVG